MLDYDFFLLSNACSDSIVCSQVGYKSGHLYTFIIIPFVPLCFLSIPLFFVAEVWWKQNLGEAEPSHLTI